VGILNCIFHLFFFLFSRNGQRHPGSHRDCSVAVRLRLRPAPIRIHRVVGTTDEADEDDEQGSGDMLLATRAERNQATLLGRLWSGTCTDDDTWFLVKAYLLFFLVLTTSCSVASLVTGGASRVYTYWLWGPKTEALYDVWSFQHIFSGISFGGVLQRRYATESRFQQLTIAIAFSYLWETTERE
jgi:hypothetical protein